MKTEVVWFKKTTAVDEDGKKYLENNLQYNREMLRDGVVGVHCVNTDMDSFLATEEWALIQQLVPKAGAPGTVERYENGAKNMFFRIVPGDPADGFVKVRPE